MRILLTNDDGYDSEGLHAVADLFKAEHEVFVVAPDGQRSAVSHSVTINHNILKCRDIGGYDYKVYAVSGTPADCVKVAVSLLFKKPDLVISGINKGRNLGSDVMYSGTVSAASDAVLLGYKAIALSIDYGAYGSPAPTYETFKACASFIKDNLNTIMSIELPKNTFLNINFPYGAPRGVKTVKTNMQDTFVDVFEQNGEALTTAGYRNYDKLDKDTDEGLCLDGYITVSPLMLDMTDYITLDKIKGTKFKL